jgi:hypothetical protein
MGKTELQCRLERLEEAAASEQTDDGVTNYLREAMLSCLENPDKPVHVVFSLEEDMMPGASATGSHTTVNDLGT